MLTLLGASRAAAQDPPYEPWQGDRYPPPPPLAAPPARDPGPAPREWARRSGELGLRGLLEGRLGGATPNGLGPPLAPNGALELVGLARVRSRGGIGLAVAAAWTAPSLPGPALAGERLSLVLRTAGPEDGAFDPYLELLAGVTRLEPGSASSRGARWGTETRVGGAVGWYLGRSLRLGAGLAIGSALLPGGTAATTTAAGPRSWRLVPSVAVGLETTLCFGPAH